MDIIRIFVNNLLTIVLIAATVWYFKCKIVHLRQTENKLNDFRNMISEAPGDLTESELIDRLLKSLINDDSICSKKMVGIISKYEKGTPVDGFIEDIIDQEDLVSTKSHNPFPSIRSSASQLVGWGILGTFIGLSWGVMRLDLSSSDSIQRGIQHLLNNVGTAFITSVVGMGLSMLYTWRSSKFYQELNSTYYKVVKIITEHNWVGVWDKQSEAVISQGAVFSKLLSSSYDIQFKIDGMAEQVSERIAASIGDRLETYQKDLMQAFQGGAGQAATEGAQKAKETFDSLVKNLVDVTAQINSAMGELTSGLKENISNLDILVDKIQITVSAFDDQVNSMGGTLSQLGLVDQSFSKINDNFLHTSNTLGVATEALSTAVDQNNRSSSSFIENWQKTNTEIQSVTTHFEEIQSLFNSASSELSKIFKDTSKEMSSFHQAVTSSTVIQMKEFRDAINDFSGRLSGAATDLQEVMEAHPLTHSAEAMSAVTEELSVSIKKSVGMMLEGMRKYQDVVFEPSKSTIIPHSESFQGN